MREKGHNMNSPQEIMKAFNGFSKTTQGMREYLDGLDKHYADAKNLPIDRNDALAGLTRFMPLMSTHSAICLLLLDALGNAEQNVDEDFVTLTEQFMENCTDDIRRYSRRFLKLCRRLQWQTQAGFAAKRAIAPLISAIGKLEESAQTITPIHPLLFQACLVAEFYSPAMPFLHPDVCNLNPYKNRLTMRDLLLFFYYGALIHIGNRDYEKAFSFLLQAITAPAIVASAIAVAAFKKYVLISLIRKGSVPELPRYTPSIVQRTLRSTCSDYYNLSTGYAHAPHQFGEADNPIRLKIIADGDGALLTLALEAHTKREILRLTDTYMTMTLQQISQAINRSTVETELILLKMIENREISAKLDDSQGLVSFEEDLSEVALSVMAQKIEAQLQESMKLSKRVNALSHEVSCDKPFIQRTEGQAAGGPVI